MITFKQTIIIALYISIAHSYLVIQNEEDSIPFPVEMNVTLGQLFLYNSPVEFELINTTLELFRFDSGVNYTGKAVFVVNDYGYPRVHQLFSCGASVFVIASSSAVPGHLSLQVKNLAIRYGYDMIAFQVSTKNEGWEELTNAIRDDGLVLDVLIYNSGNENEWETFVADWPVHFFQVLLAILAFVVFALAVEKLIFKLLLRSSGRPIDVSEIILSLEALIGLFRLIYIIVDPSNLRGVFSTLFGFYATQATSPISALTTALLLLHFNDAIKSYKNIIRDNIVIIVIIFSLLIFIGILVLPFLFFVVPQAHLLVYGMSGFYFLVFVLLSAYIFYSIPGMFKLISRFTDKRKDALLMKAYLVILSGVFTVLWSVLLVYMFLFVKYIPAEWFALNYTWLTLMLFVSLTQVLIFDTEQQYFNRNNQTKASMGTAELNDQ